MLLRLLPPIWLIRLKKRLVLLLLSLGAAFSSFDISDGEVAWSGKSSVMGDVAVFGKGGYGMRGLSLEVRISVGEVGLRVVVEA